jgi:Ca2+-binding EF-hand superfamily protein
MSKTLLTFAAALVLLGGLPLMAQEAAQAQGGSSATQAFTALDTNKDGKLSPTEFNRIFEMEGKTDASAQEKQQEFKAWDSDGDGSVSKAEFTAKYGK